MEPNPSPFVGAQKFVDRVKGKTFSSFESAVDLCRGCNLYKVASQGVFGEGGRHAPIFIVGEQPGDKEDIEGRPFVGPAGHALREILDEAGISNSSFYLTNAVKHFYNEERGKRRLHKRPHTSHVRACHPWLSAELSLIKPKVIVCLGATAANSVFGSAKTIKSLLGKISENQTGIKAIVTYHPSAMLRAPTPEDRKKIRSQIKKDLILAKANSA
jgi:uracil-DNA glycosylase family protein